MNALSHVTSMEEVIWGIGLVAITMIIHAFAMPMTLVIGSVAQRRCPNWRGFFAGGLPARAFPAAT